MSKITLAIHGGAGTILKEEMTPGLESAYREGLQAALDAGYEVLAAGGTALHAVEIATVTLEDNILFNAGRGSVFSSTGTQEMDASIMEGRTRRAGAVAGIGHIGNPVRLALAVMNDSQHVFLAGEGAMNFALKQGFKLEPDEYFFSQFRYDQWMAMRESGNYALDHSRNEELANKAVNKEKKFGTVGAVARDRDGNIAAATSTGGMTNKQYGRVGDTPMIGCGTYANNSTCAISCTGHGEPFIRSVAAYDVSCLMEYRGLTLEESMRIVVQDKLIQIGGEGGMIGVDAAGNGSMQFNSEGMYRGIKDGEGVNEVSIYR